MPDSLPATGQRYLTYPHCNGFCRDGRPLVLESRGGGRFDVLAIDPDLTPGSEQQVCTFQTTHACGWIDSAADADRLAICDVDGLKVLDLDTPNASPRLIYRPRAGERMQDVPGITPDGRYALAGLTWPDHRRYGVVIVATDAANVVHRADWPWFANHFHFCPHDPGWVGFAHEGATEQIDDRVHAWHACSAPDGPCIFDQRGDNKDTRLCVGHERWCWHDTSAMVVAYGVSPGQPRGIWQAWPNGRAPRLISEGQRDWHVNISPDGNKIVVDTTGPHDQPGRGWDHAADVSDILLIEADTGHRRHLARAKRGPSHPFHPHPTFSPDGDHVYFNDYNTNAGTPPANHIRRVHCPR